MSPVVLPSPDELESLPWHVRDRAIATARRLLADYGTHVVADGGTRYRARKAAKEAKHAQWAADVRDEARRLMGETC